MGGDWGLDTYIIYIYIYVIYQAFCMVAQSLKMSCFGQNGIGLMRSCAIVTQLRGMNLRGSLKVTAIFHLISRVYFGFWETTGRLVTTSIVVPCPHLAARSPNPNTATVILIYKDVILPVAPIGRPKGKVSWSRGAFNGNFRKHWRVLQGGAPVC